MRLFDLVHLGDEPEIIGTIVHVHDADNFEVEFDGDVYTATADQIRYVEPTPLEEILQTAARGDYAIQRDNVLCLSDLSPEDRAAYYRGEYDHGYGDEPFVLRLNGLSDEDFGNALAQDTNRPGR